ncbi:MAG: L-2-hydroxyglutarate oxidase [Solirubrobacterales bacterium]
MRVVVVGGGILGLATAWTLQREQPESEVVVLEGERALATHQTAKNSGVVHAGLYYVPGSSKARLCRRGVGLLRSFCAEHEVAYEACGKLVVAAEASERERLEALAERAEANGVEGLAWLEAGEIQRIEPEARGACALHSPNTAIVDFVAVAAALARSIQARGGEVRTAAAVRRLDGTSKGAVVELCTGESLAADRVVVCAGLHSDRLARASGRDGEPRIIPFRGEYWKLRPERAHLVRGLIYPVPDPALPFLGVHLTRKIGGEVWLGPNAVLSFALDGYRWRDARPAGLAHVLGWPGTWRLMGRNLRVGLHELRSARSKRFFIRGAQRFVPALAPGDAVRAAPGVRAQAVDRDGTLVDDFRIDRAGNVLWVRNAPSPAATSSLAIAEDLAEQL